MPGRPMRAGRQMAIEDGVDLVGAAGGLVDALGIERHHPFGGGEELIKGANVFDLQAGGGGGEGDGRRGVARRFQRFLKAARHALAIQSLSRMP